MTTLKPTPDPWYVGKTKTDYEGECFTVISSARAIAVVTHQYDREKLMYDTEQEEANAVMLAAAPGMYNQLKRIQGWLFCDLLRTDEPLNKDSAAKAYHEINALLNATVDKD